MHNCRTLILIALFAALGCGGSTTPPSDEAETAAAHDGMPNDDVHGSMSGMPDDDAHAGAMGQGMDGGMHQGGGINAEVTLDPEIADDWRAIRVRVVELSTMAESSHEVVIGEEVTLGDTGLTLRALSFVPDFVMGPDGITSRTAEPQNPAARVVIMENDKDDYEGWLFGAMPEIHAYPHEEYGVMLTEGVPAD